MDTLIQERRKVQRQRTLKGGSIVLPGEGGIDCRVRNLSAHGAMLEVASQIGVPDDFVLLIESDNVRWPCNVVWRTASRLGVAFRIR